MNPNAKTWKGVQAQRASSRCGVSAPILACVLGMLWMSGQASAALSEAQIVEQLRLKGLTDAEKDAQLAAEAAVSKGLRQSVRQPDLTGACGEGQDASRHKNLEVIPIPPPQAPRVDLSLQFGYMSYQLTAADRQQLDALARALAHPELRQGRFTVSGHTDASGDPTINLRLSCARSLTVRQYLIDQGITAARLSAYGFGSSRPAIPGAPNAAADRRVEIRRSIAE